MKTIELNYKTDNEGRLNIEYQLDRSNSSVRVLILVEDSTSQNEEKEWLKAISVNPAFEFLKNDIEDIYSLTDGEPINNGSLNFILSS